MHIDTSEYNKKKIQSLYILGGKAGETTNLLPLYDILLHMFRGNISPSGGNYDSIRGGLVYLLHHAHLTFEASVDCVGMDLNVMHFIFSYMHLAMLDRNIPHYGPYILRPFWTRGLRERLILKKRFH
jgi:hypothetical protein